MKNFIDEIRGPQGKAIGIYCDNQGAITLAKDNKFHSQTKHINLRYHFIREAVEDNKIRFEYIPMDENVADIFTKALLRPRFMGFVESLGLSTRGRNEGNNKEVVFSNSESTLMVLLFNRWQCNRVHMELSRE